MHQGRQENAIGSVQGAPLSTQHAGWINYVRATNLYYYYYYY